MITQISFKNMKYYRNRNIITGIAIFLTSVLLFILPTVGVNLINTQFEIINRYYAKYHAQYRNVDSTLVKKLSAHHGIARYGLRSDIGYVSRAEPSTIILTYIDAECAELYNMRLEEGHLPNAEDEIAVTHSMLKALGADARLGDTVNLKFQLERNGTLDYAQKKSFVIVGFIAESETTEVSENETQPENSQNRLYSALISKLFLEKEIPQQQIRYRFLFQIGNDENAYYDDVKDSIESIANEFSIPHGDIVINKQYLYANYVDPSFAAGIAIIMIIVVAAGIITIYSIYYVGMAERIRELGKLRALGAEKRQLKQIILREGLCVAAIAVPIGLLAATLLSKQCFLWFYQLYSEDIYSAEVKKILYGGEMAFYHGWIYALDIAVTFATAYISLLMPMRKASRVSETEAIRYNDTRVISHRGRRRSYTDIRLSTLAKIYITGNGKNSIVTIVSMSVTGIFVMAVATVLSCATPRDSADNDALGQYVLHLNISFDDMEHPERDWRNLIHDNPLNDELVEKLEKINGVEKASVFGNVYTKCEELGSEVDDYYGILGIPEEYADTMESAIVDGSVTYDELKSGDKVIMNTSALYWFDLQVGDKLVFTIDDGERVYEKELEIAAMIEPRYSFMGDFFAMAYDGLEKLCGGEKQYRVNIFASSDYDEEVYNAVKALLPETDTVNIEIWQEVYDMWVKSLRMMNMVCYMFLGILSVICLMNVVNTMINSVHLRKKDIGMMQAAGMTDAQLVKMLCLEGMFYMAGTLIVSIGVGSAIGYSIFLWAKHKQIFGISSYHYPITAAVVIAAVLFGVQMLLAATLGRTAKRESLIERIRFSE